VAGNGALAKSRKETDEMRKSKRVTLACMPKGKPEVEIKFTKSAV
jgi:hypothetical protein